ncbi:nematode fatty acid retinoid binding protein [Ancylostoma duodenale]|uniref:Fatty-acid and retinol-binding protein 1 n=1 Tax=Ancylostoma duodenale TaxID=51022 RepID=A0A0C2CCY4_9BILA|nr:nematode fatty acid retinoid binding protein [Ancylostoma duodenale]
MREVYVNFPTYKSDAEVVAAIKAKSPELAARIAEFHSWWNGKAAALGPEAKAYFDAMNEKAYKIRAQFYAGNIPSRAEMKQSALDTINKYKAMSAAGKADFEKHFPLMSKVLSNDEVYKRLQSMN